MCGEVVRFEFRSRFCEGFVGRMVGWIFYRSVRCIVGVMGGV